MSSNIKTVLRYPGGKAKALKKILPQVPTDFEEYREPFVGGGSVFIALRQTRDNVAFKINDLNYDLFCFWKQLRDNTNELIKEINEIKINCLDGKLLYRNLTNQDYENESELDTAVKFFVLNRITFSGLSGSGGYSQESFEKRFTRSSIERLTPLAELMQGVQITNDNYEKLLTMEGDNVFIFLDPPYLNARESKLYGKMGDLHTSFDHKHFAELMKECNHKWLITCDDSPEIRKLFNFAKKITSWELQYGVNHGKKIDVIENKAKRGKELFIYNY